MDFLPRLFFLVLRESATETTKETKSKHQHLAMEKRCGSLGEGHMVKKVTVRKCSQKARVQCVFTQTKLCSPLSCKKVLGLILLHTRMPSTISFCWSGGGQYKRWKVQINCGYCNNSNGVSAVHAESHIKDRKVRGKLVLHGSNACYTPREERIQLRQF